VGYQLLETDNSMTEILKKYADTVFRLCLIYVRNKADAEDAFQNVFLKLCKIKPSFNDEEHIKAWLITVTTNECKNLLKSFWRKNVVCIDEVISPVIDEGKKGVPTALLKLPVKYRNVLYLHYFEGYKVSELAKILNEKEATIKTRLKRGRGLMKNEMLKGGCEYE
jgi:RNA polymerase sigma factor (sigma-70 family)